MLLGRPPSASSFIQNEQGTGKSATSIRAADNAGINSGIVVITTGINVTGFMREFEKLQTIPRTLQTIRSKEDAQNLHGDVIFISHTMLIRVLPELLTHQDVQLW